MNDDLNAAECDALDRIHQAGWLPITSLGAIVVWLESRGLATVNTHGYALLTPAGHDLYTRQGISA